jgi:hypothetical protein
LFSELQIRFVTVCDAHPWGTATAVAGSERTAEGAAQPGANAGRAAATIARARARAAQARTDADTGRTAAAISAPSAHNNVVRNKRGGSRPAVRVAGKMRGA